MRYCIIEPLLINNFELQLSNLNFFFLVMSTVLLTAAGYVINDYFDRKTDMVNRPTEVVVGKYIKRRTAMAMHIVFNVVGIALGLYVSYIIGIYKLGIIFLVISGILWYYSTSYKQQFLIGNLLVSVLTALVPLMVVVYEIPLLNKAYGDIMLQNKTNFNYIFFWVAGFSFFAFLSSLIREIIKDMEDLEGDNAYGRNTLPIVLGIQTSKFITVVLILIGIAGLAVAGFKLLDKHLLSLMYFGIAIAVPYLFLIFILARADTKKDYHLASLLSKIIMLLGLCYSFGVYYTLKFDFPG